MGQAGLNTPPPAAPARRSPLPWVLLALALALAGWALWRAFGPAPAGDPLAAALASFDRQHRLTVFSAQLAPIVASDEGSMFGLLKSRQIAVIPARVDYAIDLSAMGADRISWTASTHRLDVQLPPLALGRPHLDAARAQYLLEGIWVTHDMTDKITPENTKIAEQQAMQQARNPALMALASAAAKDVVRQDLSIPLQAAGFGKVTVAVRFDGEQPR